MDIIKEGYLLKKGHIITTWKKRWHVLTLNSLDYYENESKLVKKGTIQINNYTKIDIKNNDNYKFVVYNTNNSNILEIDAKDENERNEWIFIIENVIKKYIVKLFYRDCLTVNRHANPVEVLDNILDNEFISYGAQNKSKYVLTDQVQFFWKIIPDLKWEVQEMLIEGNTVIVRSLASGSPRGDFMGITGLDGSKSFRVTTIDIHIVENGRIKYVYHLEDWGTAITQLRGNGYVASSDDNVNLGTYRRIELTAESRQAAIDVVTPFYNDCLTVNSHANPVEVLDRILADEFISVGVPNKSKQALTNQVQFFWKLIPDLKWEIQNIFVDGNKVVVRSLASGSPRGDFMGITGLDGSKSFHVTTIDIHIVENGRVKVVNHLEDWSAAKAQLE